MSDIYHRDTKRLLDIFNDKVDDLKGILHPDFIDSFETLASEVDGLLDQYESKIDDLESAKEQLEEYENQ